MVGAGLPVAVMVDLLFLSRDPCEYVKNLTFSFITLS